VAQKNPQSRAGTLAAFIAILYYEFLWNIRKKKIIAIFIIIFAIATVQLAFTPIADALASPPQTLQANPTFVFDGIAGLTGIFLFLVGVATTMNTFSGEFESGTIVPLLTKPVSKTLVFTGKIVGAVITLLAAYAFLVAYVTVGGTLIYGSQNNLNVVPLGILGLTIGSMVWSSIAIALGTLSKNSVLAALGSFGFYIGIMIAGVLIASFLGASTILFYAPGSGATGTTGVCEGLERGGGQTFSTGTDGLASMLMQWVLNPAQVLNFCGFRFRAAGAPTTTLLSSDTIGNVAFRDLWVSLIYIGGLLLLSWFAFRRSQISES
jgi:ABC-type transport system involved in multi-copper enzyme maturation permease subunit